MHFAESVRSSFQSIFSHKLRSILTLLGIMIGVFAVVTMFSTVYGLKTMIHEKMSEMGWNNALIIYPSSGEKQSKHRFRFFRMRREAKPLTFSDYTFLKSNLETKYIYGTIQVWQKYYHLTKEDWIRVTATNNDFFNSKTYPLASGRYFNSYEEANATKVCILGYHFAEKHYPESDPIGQIFTVGANRFKVVGVLEKDQLNKQGMNFNNWERRRDLEALYIPLSTGSKCYRSNNSIETIYMQSSDESTYNQTRVRATQLLLSQHNMARDFSFGDIGSFMLKITNEINEVMKKWNVTLSAIASISLIVGGIGLFSTLLISINERMKEIGIRKGIGATEMDIFLLFILEAIILALIGALIGIVLSSLLIKAASSIMDFSFPVPIPGILLGLGFAILIGFLSGLFPAIKASKIDPIKAIFYFE